MMDYFGQASETDYFDNKLSKAIKKIKEFSTLNKILKNFDLATKENHYENKLLNLAGAPNNEYDPYLQRIENLLSTLLKKGISDKRNLFFRLRYFGEQHFQKFYEIEFYLGLLDNNHISEDIKYEGKKQKHDFKFDIDGVEFNVELTSLGKGKIEQKINGAFTIAAQEILKNLPDNTWLKVGIISDKLGEIGKGVYPSDISKVIVESFNLIKPFCLVCRNDSLTLEKNVGPANKTLFECKDYFYYKESKKIITELLKSDEGVNYLKSTKIKDIKENPIDSFSVFDGKNRKVEISAGKIMDSSTEVLRKKSLIRQVKDRIRVKIKEGQLKGQINPFIAFHFEDFAFHNYYLPDDSFGQYNLNELSEIVKEVFTETSERELLGVLFYFQKLNKSAFIQNPNIEIDSKIIDKIDLLKK